MMVRNSVIVHVTNLKTSVISPRSLLYFNVCEFRRSRRSLYAKERLHFALLCFAKQSENRRRPKPLCPSDIQIKYVHLTNKNVSKVKILNLYF